MTFRKLTRRFGGAAVLVAALAGVSHSQAPRQVRTHLATNQRGNTAPVVDSANTEALLQNLRKLTEDTVPVGGGNISLATQANDTPSGTQSVNAVGGCGTGETWNGYCDSGSDCMDGCCSDLGSCCSDWGCDSACCGSCETGCCGGKYAGMELFGEFLHLRPRDAEVAYGVEVDGPVTPVLGNGIQVGRTAVVDIGRQAAFRVGFGTVNTACGRVIGAWTHFDSSESDQVTRTAPNIIRSLVTHPLGDNVAIDGVTARAQYDIDFDLIDLAAQTPLCRRSCWAWDALWGVRYGQLDQTFSSTMQFNGDTNVATNVGFDGVGPRVGLLGQRTIGPRGLYLLGRGEATFLVGSFDANYRQQSDFGGQVVSTSWEAGRIVPQLEMELGFGFGSRTGRFQMRAGYMVSAWYNAVTTDEYINAVQLNDPRDLGNGLTFDGLVVRGELRF
jgi:Legionella pneumophila major outer membrane protein precursor